MLSVDVKIDGIEGVTVALEDAFGDLEPAIMQGVKQGAEIVRSAAKSLAPVDTGDLESSIVVNGPHQSAGEISAEVVATAEHAVYVEYGTGPRGLSSAAPGAAEANVTYHTGAYARKGGANVSSGGQEAQPFMYPAYQLKKAAAAKAIANAVRKAVGG